MQSFNLVGHVISEGIEKIILIRRTDGHPTNFDRIVIRRMDGGMYPTDLIRSPRRDDLKIVHSAIFHNISLENEKAFKKSTTTDSDVSNTS